jgi:hypothetical protein
MGGIAIGPNVGGGSMRGYANRDDSSHDEEDCLNWHTFDGDLGDYFHRFALLGNWLGCGLERRGGQSTMNLLLGGMRKVMALR